MRPPDPILHTPNGNRAFNGGICGLEMGQRQRGIIQIGQRDVACDPFQIGKRCAIRQVMIGGKVIR